MKILYDLYVGENFEDSFLDGIDFDALDFSLYKGKMNLVKEINGLLIFKDALGNFYIGREVELNESNIHVLFSRKERVISDWSFNDCEHYFSELIEDYEENIPKLQEMALETFQEGVELDVDYFLEEAEKLNISNEDFKFLESNIPLIEENIISNNSEDVFKQMLSNTSPINVCVVLDSNYDCINSFYLETFGGEFDVSGYMDDIFYLLELNCEKMVEGLKELEVDILEAETEDPGVDYGDSGVLCPKEFANEFRNLSCGASNFVILLSMSAEEFVLACKNKKVLVHEGSIYGFHSFFLGGGSLLESTTKKKIELSLEKSERSEYTKFSLRLDSLEKYSVTSCHGDIFK